MRQFKIRAAAEGRKLKIVVADLLEKGMVTSKAEALPEGELPYRIDSKTGIDLEPEAAADWMPPLHDFETDLEVDRFLSVTRKQQAHQ